MDKFITDITQTLNEYYYNVVDLMPRLVLAILVFIIAYFLANGIKGLVAKRVTPKMDDPLLAKFLSRVAKVIILLIGMLFVLNIIGLGGVAGGLMASAGVGAFVLGFAFKDIGENFLAGIILAFDRPFRIGDTVELDVVKSPVVNYTIDGYLRQNFTIGLDYSANVQQAIRIIMEEIKQVKGVLKEGKEPNIAIGELTASTLNLDVYYWLDTFDKSIGGADIRIEAVTRVLARLEKEGFYLPGDIVELKNYQDRSLRTNGEKVDVA